MSPRVLFCRFLAQEAVPGPGDEDIFQGRLAERNAFYLAGERFYDRGDKFTAVRRFETHDVVEPARLAAETPVGEWLRSFQIEQAELLGYSHAPLVEAYRARGERFRALYRALRAEFAAGAG